MHLWDFKIDGIQIWNLWMPKMSDTAKHNESYLILNSVESDYSQANWTMCHLVNSQFTSCLWKVCLFCSTVKSIWVCADEQTVSSKDRGLYVHYNQKIKIRLQIDLVCRYRILGMQIWTLSKYPKFKYDFWEKAQHSKMNFWCFLVTPALCMYLHCRMKLAMLTFEICVNLGCWSWWPKHFTNFTSLEIYV